MRIYLASDHAGFALKQELIAHLEEAHTVRDMGPHTYEPGDDYPDFCTPLGVAVAGDAESFGVVIGYSGQGEAMAVNRVKGARAAVFYGGSYEVLKLSRTHNNANVLSLGAHFLSVAEAKEAVTKWLNESFSGEERHARRIAKLDN